MRFLILLFFIKAIFANELVKELKNDLKIFSNIAIKTNQNVDYMPYIISTLTHEELSAIGIQNLKEALTLLPNVDISIGIIGTNIPILRGSNPFAFGQIKLLIDGVLVNDSIFSGIYQFLDIPISIIKRIEVVRGAGSIENSINAYSGVINVVTFAEKEPLENSQSKISTTIGKYDYKMGTLLHSYVENDLKIYSDIFYQKHNKRLESGLDGLIYDELNKDLAKSGEVQNALENYSFGFSIKNRDLELKLRSFRNKSGVSYGQIYSISEDLSDYLDSITNFIDIKKEFNLNSYTTLTLNLNYLKEDKKLKNKVFPDGFKFFIDPSTLWNFTNGAYFNINYSEETFNEMAELKFDLDRHDITSGVKFTQMRVKNNFLSLNAPDIMKISNIDYLLGNLIFASQRDMLTLYLKDKFDITPKLTFESSLIYQNISDSKPELSPRISLVYRYSPNTIYKAMYTHSFREPSLREQYVNGNRYYIGNPYLDKERVDAFELAYIQKLLNNSSLKFNLFYLLNRDEIIPSNKDSVFYNLRDSDIYGLEIEYKSHLTKNDNFYINCSLNDGKHIGSEHKLSYPLANVAQTMIKGYYNYKLTNNLNFATIFKYIGSKNRLKIDNRDKLNSYKTFDTTIRYSDKNYELSLAIKNIFDEKVKFPSLPFTYKDDFIQEKRNFFINFEMVF